MKQERCKCEVTQEGEGEAVAEENSTSIKCVELGKDAEPEEDVTEVVEKS